MKSDGRWRDESDGEMKSDGDFSNCRAMITTKASTGASQPSFVWGGDRFMGTQAHLPPKMYFLLGFRPLYFENVGKMQNLQMYQEKDTQIHIIIFGGRPPLIFRLRRTRPPRPPPRFRRPWASVEFSLLPANVNKQLLRHCVFAQL